jgi:hypothetical protein
MALHRSILSASQDEEIVVEVRIEVTERMLMQQRWKEEEEAYDG